jgi:hypothetical protein
VPQVSLLRPGILLAEAYYDPCYNPRSKQTGPIGALWRKGRLRRTLPPIGRIRRTLPPKGRKGRIRRTLPPGQKTATWGLLTLLALLAHSFGGVSAGTSSEPSFRTHPARIQDRSAYARPSHTTAAGPNPGEPPGTAPVWPEPHGHEDAEQTTRWWSRHSG